ncbi:hypothetical protein EST92_10675 [Streptomyces sp. TM32]|nr:hypothetical protein EST92_10675 [Streptomyces sp. TM32]
MPKPKGFTAWLKTHADQHNAIGDLARDVSADPDWPSCKGRQGQLDYLEECGAIEAVAAPYLGRFSAGSGIFGPKLPPDSPEGPAGPGPSPPGPSSPMTTVVGPSSVGPSLSSLVGPSSLGPSLSSLVGPSPSVPAMVSSLVPQKALGSRSSGPRSMSSGTTSPLGLTVFRRPRPEASMVSVMTVDSPVGEIRDVVTVRLPSRSPTQLWRSSTSRPPSSRYVLSACPETVRLSRSISFSTFSRNKIFPELPPGENSMMVVSRLSGIRSPWRGP